MSSVCVIIQHEIGSKRESGMWSRTMRRVQHSRLNFSRDLLRLLQALRRLFTNGGNINSDEDSVGQGGGGRRTLRYIQGLGRDSEKKAKLRLVSGGDLCFDIRSARSGWWALRVFRQR